jgi:ligand-binding sensor domain-containing protein
MFKLPLTLLTIACCWAQPLLAQQHLYTGISAADGLPSNNVYNCIQDNQGYLWVCTASGLARYDGLRFEVFDYWPHITSNEIVAAAADNTGKIWFTCFSAAQQLLYYKNGQVFTPETDSALAPYRQKWFTQQLVNGPCLYLGGEASCLVIKNGQPRAAYPIGVSTLFQHTDGSVWAIGRNGWLYHISEQGMQRQWQLKSMYAGKTTFYNGKLYQFYQNEIRISAFSPQGLRLLHTVRTGFAVFNLFVNGQGIWLIDDNAHRMYHADSDLSLVQGQSTVSIEGADITLVYEDRTGNIWACSADKGLLLLKNTQVRLLSKPFGPTAFAYSVCKLPGLLLVGTNDGYLHRYRPGNTASEKVKLYRSRSRRNRLLHLVQANPYCYVACDEAIWRTGQGPPKLLYPKGGKLVYRVNDSLLLMTSISWAFLYHLQKQTVTDSFRISRVYAAASMGQRLWLGSESGLHFIDVAPGQKKIATSPMVNLRINSLAANKGVLMVATTSHGILAIAGGQVVDTLHQGNSPLLSNCVNRIKWRGDTLLAATIRGLVALQRNGAGDWRSLYTCTMADGLQSDNISDFDWGDSLLYMATNEGIAVMNTALPPTKAIYLLAGPAQVGSSSFAPGLPLTAGLHQPVTFAFGGIEYCGPQHIRYRYRLWPLEKEWQATAKGQASYVELPPGQYRFEVYALSAGGQKSSQLAIPLRITEKWWQTAMGRWLLAAAAIALNLAVFWALRRHLKKRAEHKAALRQRMLQAELNTLRSQLNPHFIFNSMNVVQDLVLQQKGKEANRFLADLSKLIRSALQLSQRNWIYLQEELDFAHRYLALEAARLDRPFVWEVWVDEGVDTAACEVPALVTQPFLENAVLHGIGHLPANVQGQLRLRVYIADGALRLVVADNGVGINAAPAAKEGKAGQRSLGLAMSQERAALLNQHYKTAIHITVAGAGGSPPQVGTTVTIVIPL